MKLNSMFISISIAILGLISCSLTPSRVPAGSGKILDAGGYLYDPSDRSCDGFPKLEVETLPGTCLGLVLGRSRAIDQRTGKPLVMPRTLLELKDVPGEFLLVDMGGWKANNGGLFLLRRHGQDYETVSLKLGLNLPHGLTRGPDGYIYVAETDKVSRFHMKQSQIVDWEIVISQIPRFKGYMHPLTQIRFDQKSGDLYLNAGAPTDHCSVKNYNGYQSCPETDEMGLGAIFRYPAAALKTVPKGGVQIREVTATGLRNSMAMVVSPTGYLIQGENGRDFPELDEPYEELNVINPLHKGRFYGWPQCFDFHATSPEWAIKNNDPKGLLKRFPKTVDCESHSFHRDSNYEPPKALMPPHAAPLNMDYYPTKGGKLSDQLGGRLLVSWHGYQPSGHRLVAYEVDEFGRPKVKAPDAAAVYFVDHKGQCPKPTPFKPTGGLDRYAPYQEVISGWDEVKGLRPKGAPVGFEVAHDGSIWIAEDRENRDIVRLSSYAQGLSSPHSRCHDEPGASMDPRIELLAWRNAVHSDQKLLEGYLRVKKELIEPFCISCHGGFKANDMPQDELSPLDYMVQNSFFKAGVADQSKMVSAVAQDGNSPPMPPGGSPQVLDQPESAQIQLALKNWIEALPQKVESNYQKIELGSGRTIRDQPGLNSSHSCGQFQAGASVFVDPRPKTRVVKDGWLWTKVYLVPEHSRLAPGHCAYPLDGVYWVALKKNK